MTETADSTAFRSGPSASEWLDHPTAIAQLGVRSQTLYAYVSRGLVERRPDPADPRRSQYRAEDLATLVARRTRGRRPRTIAQSAFSWGEASLATQLSTIHHGRLIYRGHDAVTLADTATLEDVAALLWDCSPAPTFPAPIFPAPTETAPPAVALAQLIEHARPMHRRAPARLVEDAAQAVGALATAFGAAPGTDPLHIRIAQGWSLAPAAADLIRRALVLLADHELNASTFAARVAASTGASVAASLMAGFAALTGPHHGGAGTAVIALLRDAAEMGADAAVADRLAQGRALPGFGHPLYPTGDVRAAHLLARLPPDPACDALRRAVEHATAAHPNVDFAFAQLTRAHGLPDDTPFRLFAIARAVGWAAHAMEQAASGQLIRPRAIYEGATPPGLADVTGRPPPPNYRDN